MVVWNKTPKFSQGRALLGFWWSVGIGRTIPAFSRKVLGSSVILCPSHYSFPGLFKTLQARVLPESRELFGIQMSPAGEEPESGPNQGAVSKGDRMWRPEDIHPQRDRPILTRAGYGLRCSSRGMEERERVFPFQLPSSALSDLRRGNLIIIRTLLTS